jgi:putative protease
MGIDSLKVEGRTKSAYYVARTAQSYRQAIDDAMAGKQFDMGLLSTLEGLANRGYTDGFYERHHTQDYQNYLRGHSESNRSQYVGDITAYDAQTGMASIAVKNKFSVGDKLEIIHPAGNFDVVIEAMSSKNKAVNVAPGTGHVVQIQVGQDCRNGMVARFL